ncbi:MAG: hypothetical protein AMK75_07745 [Planctomycetes bacterium SM23_65]|nr:MAG: hypothetical protein AMK75_07745 [Planctomycetes bacterium SM23_65]
MLEGGDNLLGSKRLQHVTVRTHLERPLCLATVDVREREDEERVRTLLADDPHHLQLLVQKIVEPHDDHVTGLSCETGDGAKGGGLGIHLEALRLEQLRQTLPGRGGPQEQQHSLGTVHDIPSHSGHEPALVVTTRSNPPSPHRLSHRQAEPLFPTCGPKNHLVRLQA